MADDKMIAGLLKSLEPIAVPGAQRLHHDIKNHYQGKKFGRRLKTAWDEVILRRLQALSGGDKALTDLALDWRTKISGVSLTIRFGQMRVGPDFQGALSADQNAIVGFPVDQVVGRPLNVVAGAMTGAAPGIAADQIPVQIFYSDRHQTWVAANNRGYTAHCKAGVRPLRLWPREPSQDELNRLGEVEGERVGERFLGPFRYSAATADRLADNPHTLPSFEMPVTNGPNSWEVMDVVKVPEAWR